LNRIAYCENNREGIILVIFNYGDDL